MVVNEAVVNLMARSDIKPALFFFKFLCGSGGQLGRHCRSMLGGDRYPRAARDFARTRAAGPGKSLRALARLRERSERRPM